MYRMLPQFYLANTDLVLLNSQLFYLILSNATKLFCKYKANIFCRHEKSIKPTADTILVFGNIKKILFICFIQQQKIKRKPPLQKETKSLRLKGS